MSSLGQLRNPYANMSSFLGQWGQERDKQKEIDLQNQRQTVLDGYAKAQEQRQQTQAENQNTLFGEKKTLFNQSIAKQNALKNLSTIFQDNQDNPDTYKNSYLTKATQKYSNDKNYSTELPAFMEKNKNYHSPEFINGQIKKGYNSLVASGWDPTSASTYANAQADRIYGAKITNKTILDRRKSLLDQFKTLYPTSKSGTNITVNGSGSSSGNSKNKTVSLSDLNYSDNDLYNFLSTNKSVLGPSTADPVGGTRIAKNGRKLLTGEVPVDDARSIIDGVHAMKQFLEKNHLPQMNLGAIENGVLSMKRNNSYFFTNTFKNSGTPQQFGYALLKTINDEGYNNSTHSRRTVYDNSSGGNGSLTQEQIARNNARTKLQAKLKQLDGLIGTRTNNSISGYDLFKHIQQPVVTQKPTTGSQTYKKQQKPVINPISSILNGKDILQNLSQIISKSKIDKSVLANLNLAVSKLPKNERMQFDNYVKQINSKQNTSTEKPKEWKKFWFTNGVGEQVRDYKKEDEYAASIAKQEQHQENFNSYQHNGELANKFKNTYSPASQQNSNNNIDNMKKYLSDTAGRQKFNTFMRDNSLNFRDALDRYYDNKGK